MSYSLKALVCAAFKKERPLDADDPTYVDLNRVRHSELVCRTIEQFITLAPDNPRSQLLTGQRGSGKTTELKRIAGSLERAGYVVIHFETEPFVELEDITVTDVLVAILRAVADGLKTRNIPAVEAPGDSIRALLSEWANLLTSRVELDTVDIDAGVIKLGFEATHTATVRERVRTLLSTRPQVLDDGIREYIEAARDRVVATGRKGLVVMVDNLDRVSSHNVPNTGISIYRLLLVEGAPRLSQLPCHLVYTVPSDLRFSLEGRNVEIAFGSEIQFLPLVPTHYPNGHLNQEGVTSL
jgi:Cdc6-like AAA superfamily ATPase